MPNTSLKASATPAMKPSLVGLNMCPPTSSKMRTGIPRPRQVSQPVFRSPPAVREAPGLIRSSAQNHPISGLVPPAAVRPRSASTGIPTPRPAHVSHKRHRSAVDDDPLGLHAIAPKPPSTQVMTSKPTPFARPTLSRAAGIARAPLLEMSAPQRPSLPRRTPVSGSTLPVLDVVTTAARPSAGPLRAAGRLARPSGPNIAVLSPAQAPQPSAPPVSSSHQSRPRVIIPRGPIAAADRRTSAGTLAAASPLASRVALEDHETGFVQHAYYFDSPPTSPLSAYSVQSDASTIAYSPLCAPWADSPLAEVSLDELYEDYGAVETIRPGAARATRDLIEELDNMLNGAQHEPFDSSSSSEDDEHLEVPIAAPAVKPLRIRRNTHTVPNAPTRFPAQAPPARSLTILLLSCVHTDVYEAYRALRHLEITCSQELFRDDESVFGDV